MIKKIQQAIVSCALFPGYSVGIFLNSNDRKQVLSYEIENLIRTLYEGKGIGYKIDTQFCVNIKLTNGSILDLFNVGNLPQWKGRKYACIIYDSDINEAYINEVILRLVTCFYKKWNNLSRVIKLTFY